MRLQRFGIFAPILGLDQSFPTMLLTDAATPDALNVRTHNGEIQKSKGRKVTLDTCGDPAVAILHYHYLEQLGGTAVLFAFCASGVYKWNATTSAWDAIDRAEGAAYTEATDWWTAAYDDTIIAVNGQDIPLYYDSNGDMEELGTDGYGPLIETASPNRYITNAVFVIIFEGYVIFGGVTETTAGYIASRFRYAGLGGSITTLDFETTGGSVDVAGSDALTGGIVWGNYLYLFKQRSVWRYWLVSSDDVFNGELVSDAFGCTAPKSAVIDANGRLQFLATDGTIRDQDGQIISQKIQQVLTQIPPATYGTVRAARIDEYGETWMAVPYGAAGSENSLVITRNRDGVWNTLDFPIIAFGKYKPTTTAVIDDFDDVLIDDADWLIDYVGSDAGFPIDIAPDDSGETLQLHASNGDVLGDIDAYFSLATDLSDASDLVNYKRVNRAQLYFRSEADTTIILWVRRDEERSWQQISDSIDLFDDGDIAIVSVPCDVRARHFRWKIESDSGPFRFLGAVFDFVVDGVA